MVPWIFLWPNIGHNKFGYPFGEIYGKLHCHLPSHGMTKNNYFMQIMFIAISIYILCHYFIGKILAVKTSTMIPKIQQMYFIAILGPTHTQSFPVIAHSEETV